MTMRERERTAKTNYQYYKRSDMRSLDDAYTSASNAKHKAWRYCIELCYKMNGHDLKVINKNTFVFTAGFEFVDDESGVCKFMYITPNYDTAIEI